MRPQFTPCGPDTERKDPATLQQFPGAARHVVVALNRRQPIGGDRDSLIGRCPWRSRGHHVPARRARRRGGARDDSRQGRDLRERIDLDISRCGSSCHRHVIRDGGGAVAERHRQDAGGKDVHQFRFHFMVFGFHLRCSSEVERVAHVIVRLFD